MTVLSPLQIAVLIAHNGTWGPGGDQAKVEKFLDTAIAVCLAESGGDTQAKNAKSSASGLWQIMVSAHQDLIGDRDIFDPVVNTDVAAKVYNAAGGWSPWEAYNTGAYKKFTGKGAKAYSNLKLMNEVQLGKAYADILALPAREVQGISKTFTPEGIIDFVRQGGKVVGLFVAGAILLILGVWFILSRTNVGKTVKSGAKLAAKVVV